MASSDELDCEVKPLHQEPRLEDYIAHVYKVLAEDLERGGNIPPVQHPVTTSEHYRIWREVSIHACRDPLMGKGITIRRDVRAKLEQTYSKKDIDAYFRKRRILRHGNFYYSELVTEQKAIQVAFEEVNKDPPYPKTPESFFATEEDWKKDFPNVKW